MEASVPLDRKDIEQPSRTKTGWTCCQNLIKLACGRVVDCHNLWVATLQRLTDLELKLTPLVSSKHFVM